MRLVGWSGLDKDFRERRKPDVGNGNNDNQLQANGNDKKKNKAQRKIRWA